MSQSARGHTNLKREPTIEERAHAQYGAEQELLARRRREREAEATAAAKKAALPKPSTGDLFAEMQAEEDALRRDFGDRSKAGASSVVIGSLNQPHHGRLGGSKKKATTKKNKKKKKAAQFKLPCTVRAPVRAQDADAGAGTGPSAGGSGIAAAAAAATAPNTGSRGASGAARAPPPPPFTSAEALLQAHQRDLNAGGDPDVRVRKKALERLHLSLIGPVDAVAPTPILEEAEDLAQQEARARALELRATEARQKAAARNAARAEKAAKAEARAEAGSNETAEDEKEDEDEDDGEDEDYEASRIVGRQRASVLRDAFPDASKPLLRLFTDASEAVRELAVRLYTVFVEAATDLGPYLPYFFPVLMSRISKDCGYDVELQVFYRNAEEHTAKKLGRVSAEQEERGRATIVEPAEEIRLLHCRLLGTLLRVILRQGAAQLLSSYFHEAIIFLQNAAGDPFPDLKIEACSQIVHLARYCVEGTKLYAIGLARALSQGLDHRHARVRMAAIQAVHAVVKCPKIEKCKGAGTEAIVDLIGHRDSNVLPIAAFYRSDTTVNFFAKLVLDRSQMVRARFYEMIGDWACHLLDRADHWSRLTPYLLTGFGDESAEIQRTCCDAIAELGREYEKEHYDEIQDRRQYGVEGGAHINLERPWPAPFDANGGRPRLGTRLFVRGQVRRFTGPLLGELTNWVSKTRLSAARLLLTVVVFQEDAATSECHELLRALQQTVLADEGIGEAIERVAEQVGGYLDPSTFIPQLLPLVVGDPVKNPDPTSETRAAALKTLAAMLRGAKPSLVLPHARLLCGAMQDENLHTATSPELHAALMSAAEAMCAVLEGRGRAALEVHFRETGRLASLDPMLEGMLRVLLLLRARVREDEGTGGAGSLEAQPQPRAQTQTQAQLTPPSPGEARINDALLRLARAWRDDDSGSADGGGGGGTYGDDEAGGSGTVAAFVANYYGPLLASVAESFPRTSLWSPRGSVQRLLEELLAAGGDMLVAAVRGVGGGAPAPAVPLIARHTDALVALFASLLEGAGAGAGLETGCGRTARLHNAALLLRLLRDARQALDAVDDANADTDADDAPGARGLAHAWRRSGPALLRDVLLLPGWREPGSGPGLACAQVELLAMACLDLDAAALADERERARDRRHSDGGSLCLASILGLSVGGREAKPEANGGSELAPALVSDRTLREAVTAGSMAPVLAAGLGLASDACSGSGIVTGTSSSSIAISSTSAGAGTSSNFSPTASAAASQAALAQGAAGRLPPPSQRLLCAKLAEALLGAAASGLPASADPAGRARSGSALRLLDIEDSSWLACLFDALLLRLADSKEEVRASAAAAVGSLALLIPTTEPPQGQDQDQEQDQDQDRGQKRDYAGLVQACLVQLRVTGEAESNVQGDTNADAVAAGVGHATDFAAEMTHTLRKVAVLDPAAFVRACEAQLQVAREQRGTASGLSELLDHGELLVRFQDMKKNKNKQQEA